MYGILILHINNKLQNSFFKQGQNKSKRETPNKVDLSRLYKYSINS